MLLVQFTNEAGARRVAVLEQGQLRVIDGYASTYALAQTAIAGKTRLAELAAAARSR